MSGVVSVGIVDVMVFGFGDVVVICIVRWILCLVWCSCLVMVVIVGFLLIELL